MSKARHISSVQAQGFSALFQKKIYFLQDPSLFAVLFFFIIALCLAVPNLIAQTDDTVAESRAESMPYVLFKQGQYRQAIEQAQIQIESDRQNISSYVVQGWSYLSLRQWGKALQTAQRAYTIASNDIRVIEIIGEAYYELKRYDEAKEYLAKYLRLAPDGQLRGWVYFFLGNIYLNENKPHKADIVLTAAAEGLAGKTAKLDALILLAEVKEELGYMEDAIDTYREILKIDKDNDIARRSVLRLVGQQNN